MKQSVDTPDVTLTHMTHEPISMHMTYIYTTYSMMFIHTIVHIYQAW